jgi:hypothetical protein
MSDATFDPFDLPSSFDPLQSDFQEPTGQSAYSRRGPEPTGQSAYSRRVSLAPTGQSAYSRRDPPLHRRQAPASPGPLQSCDPPEIGAGNRLAHLLQPGDQPAANLQRAPACGTATSEPEDLPARLAALEDDVAILAARLDSLHTAVNERLGDQRERLVKAVAALLDERLGPRR